MKKENVAAFFDRCAPWWDSDMIRHEDIIATILDNAYRGITLSGVLYRKIGRFATVLVQLWIKIHIGVST